MSKSGDYENKLNSLKMLKQAMDNGLITREQYNYKQQEFLNVVNFPPPTQCLPSIHHQDPNQQVAVVMMHMERELERSKMRENKRAFNYYEYDYDMPQRKLYKTQHSPSGGLGSLSELCAASYDTEYDYDSAYRAFKYSTFSEFIYDAVKALGGAALLQTIYKYAYDHQTDIDPKFAYRFRDNEYKSNVRSTLHNTGAFTKNTVTGEWAITGKLKTRK